MDPEVPAANGHKSKGLDRNNLRALLVLAYQSLGVVYGDLSTSPLYVYKSTFVRKLQYHESEEAVLGVLSLIFWTLTLIPVLKYMFIVLSVQDNGEGGTFALYSLLCRHANISPLPNQQSIDEEVSTYKSVPSRNSINRSWMKSLLEGYAWMRTILLVVVLFGTSMSIGDGILTPAISVLSSVSGLQVPFPGLHDNVIILLACIILIGLFTLQHFGTHRVAFLFAPVVTVWLLFVAGIGVYNIVHWNLGVFRALSPIYIFKFFSRTGKEGWISLGGVLLCVTGTEAMFADLGHFTQASIRTAFICFVYPCLVLAYTGQAAFLSKNVQYIDASFYASVPKSVFWPFIVVATLATIVGSQAVISATFSIIKQCNALGFFPRVKIVHTSKQMAGQIYIPEINWILMILCLAITIGFMDTTNIGNAYGFAFVTVMLVTTCLMSLVIGVVLQKGLALSVVFFLFFGLIEGVYFSASLIKIPEGGWVPLVLAALFMVIMYVWYYGTLKKYEFDMQNKVSMRWILSLGPSLGIVRVPGIGLVYTELVSGVPAIFSHFVTNLPAFHQILVFVCIKTVPVPYVPADERYVIGRVGPKEYSIYRCIVRYGYKDIRKDDHDFETQLILNLGEFVQAEGSPSRVSAVEALPLDRQMIVVGTPNHCGMRLVPSQVKDGEDKGGEEKGEEDDDASTLVSSGSKSLTLRSFGAASEIESPRVLRRRVRFELPKSPFIEPAAREEMLRLIQAKEAGIAYILGHSYVKSKRASPFLKRIAIDVGYSFLRKNCRGPAVVLSIPHICLIEVGMIYYV